MKFLRRLLRRILAHFYTPQVSLRSEAYKITFFLTCLIFLAMLIGVLFGEAHSFASALHWAIRVLFEDFDSLESYPTHVYPIAFFLKLAGHMFVPLFITFLTAKILSVHFLRRDAKNFEDHTIVVGTPPEPENFLQAIYRGGIDSVVILGHLENVRTIPLEMRVVFLPWTGNGEQDLDKANVQKAKNLLLLPELEESWKDFEAKAVLATVTAKQYNPKIHILLSTPKSYHLEHLYQLGVEEILSQEEMLASLVAMALKYPGTSSFFNEILATSYGSFLALEPLPKEYLKKPFLQVLLDLKEKHNQLLLGVKRKGRIFTNPHKLSFEEDDWLFVLKESEE